MLSLLIIQLILYILFFNILVQINQLKNYIILNLLSLLNYKEIIYISKLFIFIFNFSSIIINCLIYLLNIYIIDFISSYYLISKIFQHFRNTIINQIICGFYLLEYNFNIGIIKFQIN